MAKSTEDRIRYKSYKHNPRKISQKQLSQLEDTLRRLGDLSGIVYNHKSKQMIGGNQRSVAIDFDTCELEIIKRNAKPDKQGTTAVGFVIWEGSRYNFREVHWDAKTEREANIVANKGGGDWDFDALQQYFKADDLLSWGFTKKELTWLESNTGSSSGITLEPVFQVVVDCEGEAMQQDVFNLLQKHGYECRILTL